MNKYLFVIVSILIVGCASLNSNSPNRRVASAENPKCFSVDPTVLAEKSFVSDCEDTYRQLRTSCTSSRTAIFAGNDLSKIREVSSSCSQAVAVGCGIYFSKNSNHIKAADATNAANMCALVSGYKTIEYFGFVGQYDGQCKDSYRKAQSEGKASDWYNSRCFPDDLLSCISPTSKSKISPKFQREYEACSIVTQAKRLEFVQEFIDKAEDLP